MKTNKIPLGMVLGIIAPVITFFVYYLYNKAEFGSFSNFMSLLSDANKYTGVITKIASLCVVPNLVIFFVFIRKNFLYAARGVLLSTFLYGIVIFIIYYFFQ